LRRFAAFSCYDVFASSASDAFFDAALIATELTAPATPPSPARPFSRVVTSASRFLCTLRLALHWRRLARAAHGRGLFVDLVVRPQESVQQPTENPLDIGMCQQPPRDREIADSRRH
jgi:hypothetical protein